MSPGHLSRGKCHEEKENELYLNRKAFKNVPHTVISFPKLALLLGHLSCKRDEAFSHRILDILSEIIRKLFGTGTLLGTLK